MQRKLTPDFIKDFKPGGKYDSIIPAVKADSDLSLEIRTKSEVKIYYNKGLILTINNKGVIILSDGYFRNQERPTFDLKSPQRYFAKAKEYLIEAASLAVEGSWEAQLIGFYMLQLEEQDKRNRLLELQMKRFEP